MQLLNKYPFLVEYFNEGANNPDFSIFQSLLFYGNDLEAQYNLALYIAKLLNCTGDKNEFCNCQNCNWIEENAHPAVKTISKIDNKPEDDESKTVISIKQAQMVKISLNNMSDYHRVFIFCDKNSDDEVMGLNQFNFQEETANALLKVIEEPPQKTTFIFLTRDKNDILQTIQSRCMAFFVPSFEEISYDYDLIKADFENYFEFERTEAFDVAKKLFELGKTSDHTKVLDNIQNYMLQVLKSNLDNKLLKIKLIEDLKSVELSKKEIALNINPQNIFEDLCLKIIK